MDDATPLPGSTPAPSELLPDWYMPAPALGARALTGRRRTVAIVVIAAFLLVNALGLCATYGVITIG